MSTLIEKPEWASAGTVSVPSLAKQALGWVGGGEKPGFKTVNWLKRQTFRWIDNLAGGAATYASIEEFIESGESGDTGLLNTVNPAGRGTSLAQLPFELMETTTANLGEVTTDGQYWYCATSAVFQSRARLDPNTVVQTYTEAGTPTTRFKIVSNGSLVAMAYDNVVEVRTVADVAVGSVTLSDVVNDICITGDRIYATDNSGVVSEIGLDAVVGTQVSWGGVPVSVCSDGAFVYVGGPDASGAGAVVAGANIVSLDADFTGFEWEISVTGNIASPSALALDLDGLVHYTNDSNTIGALRCTDGSQAIPETSLTVDRCYVVGDSIYFLEPNTGLYTTTLAAYRGGETPPLAIANSTVDFFATDGDVILLTDSADGDLYLGPNANRVKRWRRADPANDVYLSIRHYCQPME